MNKYSIILLVGIAAVGLASDELEYRPIKVGTTVLVMRVLYNT
jgi:hypothetical protein